MKNRISILMIGALLLATQPLLAGTPAAPAAADATTATSFGEAIAADVAVKPLRDAIAGDVAAAGAQAISGRVGQVCQKGGCWMTLTDGDVMARVMTAHKFALPKDLSGQVVVFGKLEAIDLDAKEIEHMAKDSGKATSTIAAREYRIAATGVALR